jgi:hypothetical protein
VRVIMVSPPKSEVLVRGTPKPHDAKPIAAASSH